MTIIDTDKLLRLLRSNPTAAYTISKHTGINRTTIAALRKGTQDVNSLTIRTAKIIQDYLEENQNEH